MLFVPCASAWCCSVFFIGLVFSVLCRLESLHGACLSLHLVLVGLSLAVCLEELVTGMANAWPTALRSTDFRMLCGSECYLISAPCFCALFLC